MFRCLLPWLVLLLVRLAAPGAHAQTLRFQRLTTAHGLANDNTSALTQDAAGFIWVSTREGLARFDGVEFRNFYYEARRTNSLPGNIIGGVAPVPGGLWVTTLSGLARYDARTGRFRRFPARQPGVDSAAANHFDQVLRRRNGEVWAATHTGLWRLSPQGRVRRCYVAGRVRGDLPHNWLVLGRRTEDAGGRLWIGTVKGLSVYDPATDTFWSRRHNPRGLHAFPADTTVAVTAVTLDARGGVWFGSWGRGLFCFDPATNALRHYASAPGGLPDNVILALLADQAGAIWVGTLDHGLARLDPQTGQWAHFPPAAADPYALPHHSVHDLLEDRQGNLWVATGGGVAVRAPLANHFQSWGPERWGPRVVPPGQRPPEPSALLEDHAGRLWLGTYGRGLVRFDAATGQSRHYPLPPRPGHPEDAVFNPRNLIDALAEDRAGLLWVGTDVGLLRFDPAREQWLSPPPAPTEYGFLHEWAISALLPDRQGRLWVSCYQRGLTRYDPATGHWQRFGTTGGTSAADTLIRGTRGLALAPNGSLWAAGYCLTHVPSGARRGNRLPPDGRRGPVDPTLHAVLVDSGGTVWTGSQRRGVARLDPRTGQLSRYGRDDGLAAELVNTLCLDGRHRLWIGTNGGLSVREPAGGLRTFTPADGLPESDVVVSRYSLRTGYLWLATTSYLLRVRPDELPRNRIPPPLVLTGFVVNGRTRALPAPDTLVTLRPGEATVSFDFAALNLLSPRRNQYAWRLEGQQAADTTWSQPAARRSVTFVDLPPGEYRFRVKAANNDGVWNERGITVRLCLLPPWYATWWFRTLLFLAGLAILYGFYRQRVARLLVLQQARDRIARDLHDDVGSTLSSILIQSRMPVPVGGPDERLRRVGDSAQRMLEALHDIVWAVNPDHDPLPTIIARMRAFAAQTLEARGIALDFRVEGQPGKVELRLGRRRDFYLFFKEAINNLAKHSGAEIATVRLHVESRQIRFIIHDDGTGFDPAQVARGNGLRSLRKRADALGAKYEFTTALRRGTRHELTFRP